MSEFENNHSITAVVRSKAATFGARPAIIDGDITLSYQQLFDRIDRLSQAVQQFGIQPKEAFTAWLPNCYQAVECELASHQMGTYWLTLNTQLTATEVLSALKETGARLLITTQNLLEKLKASGPLPVTCWLIDEEYERQIQAAAAITPQHRIKAGDIARLRYTSGTTGKAKAAMLSHRVYHATFDYIQRVMHRLDEHDRILHIAPLTHAGGAIMYPTFAKGGCNVITNGIDAEQTLQQIEKHRITTLFTVPTILQRLCQVKNFLSYDLSSLKTVTYGGAPMPESILNLAMQRFPGKLLHIYGMTEAPFPLCALSHEAHQAGNPNLRSVGKPSGLCQIEVRSDQSQPLATGEIGEIFLSGPNVMSGYWQAPEITAETLQNGWLATGDLGYFNEAGYLFIVDRKKDVIISGGFNVYSKEVEALISQFSGVDEIAVVGLPDPEWGERVTAYIVAKPAAVIDSAALIDHCKTQLSAFKCPKAVFVLKELPKNSSGKILKREIIRQANEKLTALSSKEKP